ARQPWRPAKQLLSFDAVPLSEPHLGEPLQTMRLACGGADVMVQLGGLRQLRLRLPWLPAHSSARAGMMRNMTGLSRA
ncbi:MAG TPA: hypothetical protein VIQ76_02900, partial [Propionibacteriaceae bacterium]